MDNSLMTFVIRVQAPVPPRKRDPGIFGYVGDGLGRMDRTRVDFGLGAKGGVRDGVQQGKRT
jgi:hypothetical protein